MIDLRPDQLATVRQLLARHVPGCEVWAFGSRVTGTAKRYSDLDLALRGHEAMPTRTLIELEEAFSESDLPFKVDILDWATTEDSFRRVIENAHEVIQTTAESVADKRKGEAP